MSLLKGHETAVLLTYIHTKTGAPLLALLRLALNTFWGTKTSRTRQSSVVRPSGACGGSWESNSSACVTLNDDVWFAVKAVVNSEDIASQLGNACGQTLPTLPS